jgi:hypothetical protein
MSKKKEVVKELNQDNFVDEILPIIKKYELKNVIFAAEKDDMFWGQFALERTGVGWSFQHLALCLGNAGRIFQSCREKLLLIKI